MEMKDVTGFGPCYNLCLQGDDYGYERHKGSEPY